MRINLSVDKNFFAQQSFQVLGIAMQTRPDTARAVIDTHLTGDDTTVYPLERAKRELISYFDAGTLTGGLQQIQEQAGKDASDQKNSDKNKAELH